MLQLENDQLRVELLDPFEDRIHLGERFCWAGYIWQVHDAVAGPLLAGPEWPRRNPIPFNGQGLPESFRNRSRHGHPYTWRGKQGVAIGAGKLASDAQGEVFVAEPCRWIFSLEPTHFSAHTRQASAGFDYELVRSIDLVGRTLVSRSTLTNHARNRLVLEWFAHPFFALTDGLMSAELPDGSDLVDNPGFLLAGRRLFQKRRFRDAKDGHMEKLRLAVGRNLRVRFAHPRLTYVELETSFAPSECIIWGNSNTFSLEPYQSLSLDRNQSKSWSISYVFGPLGPEL